MSSLAKAQKPASGAGRSARGGSLERDRSRSSTLPPAPVGANMQLAWQGAPRAGHYASGIAAGLATPVQTASVQLQADVDTRDEAASPEDGVQMMCAECEAEMEEEQEAPLQSKPEPGAEAPESAQNSEPEEDNPPQMTVQMWDCSDYPEPTCTMQTKEEGNAGADGAIESDERENDAVGEIMQVQNKCSACEQEEESSGPNLQSKSSSGAAGAGQRRKSSLLRQAGEGLQNAHGSLPYSERIQAAFGRHDVSEVRTEIGGSAGRASERMGALAYTSGDKIGFRRTPSLHLAAHEAAHTVQQRAGLKLPGNVGKPGDRWERHADQVADAVVAGRSAEPLLDSVAPTPSRPPANGSVATAGSAPAAKNNSAAAPAGGNGIAPLVQGAITSGASHQVEPELAEEERAAGGAGAEEESAGGAAGGGAEGGQGEDSGAAEETAEAAAENEPDPAADCELAEGGGEDEPAQEEQQSGGEGGQQEQAAGGPSQRGRCYSASTEDPPPGSEEPSGDSPPNRSEPEAEVTYGAWEEPNDACECAAAESMQQQGASAEQGQSLLTAQVAEPGPGEAVASGRGDGGAAGGGGESGGGDGEIASGEEVAAGEGAGSGGGGEGGGAAQDEAPTEFTQNEATRDAAVEEYHAATDEIMSAPIRARKLSRGLTFKGGGGGSAAQEAARAMALSQIRSFMQEAAAQVDDAVAFVTGEVPARLGGMAEAVKAGIEASIAEQKAAISARVRAARAAASGEAAAAREAIESEYAGSVELVNSQTDAALQTLGGVYETSQAAVDVGEDGALAEVSSKFSDGRASHEDRGDEYAAAALATGQEWVSSYDHCRSGPGNDNEYNGDDGTWDGCLTVRRAQAQQKAACTTSSAVAKNMVDMAKKKGFELREQRTQYRCAVIAGAGQAQSTLDTTIERLTSGLESGRSGTLAGLAQVRDMNLSAVDAALAATLGNLDRQERQQRQAVNDSGYVQQVAVEELAHKVAAGLAGSVGSAVDTLEATLRQLSEQLLEGEVPPPDALAQALVSARDGLAGGMGTLLGKMEEGTASAEMQLLQSGSNAAAALAEIASGNDSAVAEMESGFQSQLSALVGAASQAMGQLTERQVTRAEESAAQGSESMEQVVAGFEDSLGEIYTRVDGAIDTSLGELDTELENMQTGLEPRIAAEAWRAASKEQPAWKGVVAIVLIVLVIIASIVVTVLTAGAAGPVALVIIGAIVGGITAGLIQVINNWAAGEEWDKGLVKAIVIGAVGGALGGAIGAGANGLAQAAIQGAVRAGAGSVARAAINVGINLAGDMVAEGATQAFSYFAYGDKFNWQGFVMAGGMSVLSTARGGITGGPRPAGARPDVNVPTPGRGARPSLGVGSDAALGAGFGLAMEGVHVLAGGEFDLNRFASTAAGAAGGSWAAGRGNAPGRRGAGGDVPDSLAPRARTTSSEPAAAPTSRPQAETTSPTLPRSAPELPGGGTPRPSGESGVAAGRPRASAETPEVPTLRPGDADQPSGSRPRVDGDEPSAPRRSGDADADVAPSGRRTGEGSDTAPSRRDTGGDAAPGRQRAGVDADQPPRQRPGADEPINQKSSAEVEDMTRTRSKIGDTDHENYVRKPGERTIECDICSRACAPIKQKINDIENELAQKARPDADDADLLSGLQEIKGRVRAAEDSIEGRLVDGEFMAGESVIRLAGEVADGFRALGQRHNRLGDAINDPAVVRGDRDPFALSGRGANADVDVSALRRSDQLDLTQRRTVGMDEFDSVAGSLARDQQLVYVLRGPPPDRVILKVGKSQQSNVGGRFGKYARAGREMGMDLTLEVSPLRTGATETDASGVESALRSGLEHEGHIMPWDNTPGGFSGGHQHTGRLNRPGTGVPFEPIRGPSYKSPSTGKRLRGEAEHEWTPGGSVRARDTAGQPTSSRPSRPSADTLRDLLQQNGNDVSMLRNDLARNHGIERSMSTIYRWLREAGVSL